MRRKIPLLFLLLIPSIAIAQNWSGILNGSRAIDWRNVAGVTFTIPSGSFTQCGSTIAAYSGSSATITSAIAACTANHFVLLGSGTFTITSGCIDWAGHSGVVLRGAGPLATRVVFTGSGCGGFSGNTDVAMRAAINTFDQSGAVGSGGAVPASSTASNNLALTGTTEGGAGVYPQGATHIQVANVGDGSDPPKVGTVLFIDQADDVATANGWLTCQQTGNPACSANGNNAGRLMGGVLREQNQSVVITTCNGSSVVGTSCGSAAGTYVISPGLYAPNWRASQNPGAWWNISSDLCKQCGVENLTFDHITSGATGGFVSAINIVNCYQCWLKNFRNIGSGGRNHFYIAQSEAGILRDSYIEGSVGHTSGGGYGIDPLESNDWLAENNIFDQVPAPLVGENYGSWVFGYNFTWNNNPGGGLIETFPSHDPGAYFNLLEGNYLNGISQDTQHGGGMAFTYFRNDIPGQQPVPVDIHNGGTQNQSPFEFQAFQHALNVIGNVLGMLTCSGGTFAGRTMDKASQCTGGTTGGSFNTNYEASPNNSITSPCYTSIYVAGWVAGCTGVSGNFHSDADVINEMMRWGNCDSVNAACRFVNAEVPTGTFPFLTALSVPSSHTLPSSFYYNSTPSWWHGVGFSTPPFPPIGPDVTSGNLATLPTGVAFENLARLCYENTAQDSTNYPGTLIIAFDANACYSNSGNVFLSPSSQNFGSVTVGSSGSPITFTLSNTSVATATAITPTTTGGNSADFTITNSGAGSCGAAGGSIATGNSCTFTVTFSPSASGARSTTLSVSYSGGDGASPQTSALSGTGVGAGATVPSGISNGTTISNGVIIR